MVHRIGRARAYGSVGGDRGCSRSAWARIFSSPWRGRKLYREGRRLASRGGKSKPINNVDLPDQIFLRWQSLVEPQAYKARIPIPQWVRAEMVRPERVYCRGSKEWIDGYRFAIALGMAPGGIVKVWVGGPCLGFKEVGRYQAKVEQLGPNQDGKGLFYRAPNPAAQAWIDQHGIPYGSW